MYQINRGFLWVIGFQVNFIYVFIDLYVFCLLHNEHVLLWGKTMKYKNNVLLKVLHLWHDYYTSVLPTDFLPTTLIFLLWSHKSYATRYKCTLFPVEPSMEPWTVFLKYCRISQTDLGAQDSPFLCLQIYTHTKKKKERKKSAHFKMFCSIRLPHSKAQTFIKNMDCGVRSLGIQAVWTWENWYFCASVS